MALNDITINKGQGGLGRPLEGTDYVSGLLFYSASLPSGFDSSNRIKSIFSVAQAEDLGITNATKINSVDTHLPTRYITSLPNSLKPSDL